jgi:hypothetical protein
VLPTVAPRMLERAQTQFYLKTFLFLIKPQGVTTINLHMSLRKNALSFSDDNKFDFSRQFFKNTPT